MYLQLPSTEKSYYVILPFYTAVMCHSQLYDPYLTCAVVKSVFSFSLQGLAYLHEKSLMHRDIKVRFEKNISAAVINNYSPKWR